jgi:hypothetical protein
MKLFNILVCSVAVASFTVQAADSVNQQSSSPTQAPAKNASEETINLAVTGMT